MLWRDPGTLKPDEWLWLLRHITEFATKRYHSMGMFGLHNSAQRISCANDPKSWVVHYNRGRPHSSLGPEYRRRSLQRALVLKDATRLREVTESSPSRS